ncbi:MAG: ferritin-like domain-containing protein [Deltaproteobacteria bacterium]|nr:MAG: ferritin-like domain-containing protein [Deltaproteobacteria bacterium]
MAPPRFDDPALHAALALALFTAGCVRSQPKPDEPQATQQPDGEVEALPPTTAQSTPASESGSAKACTGTLEVGPGVKPASPFDGWVVRSNARSVRGAEPQEQEVGRGGTPCANATDQEACEDALAAPMPEGEIRSESTQSGPIRWQGVATAGDRVEPIVDLKGLRAFLGPIDSEGDAIALVWALGYEPACPEPQAEGDAFVVHANKRISDCPITDVEYTVTVQPDGSVDALEVGRRESQACIGRLPASPSPAPILAEGLAGWLARAAWLEAQAVHAFAHLERELRHHGAPEALIQGCVAAQEDERRHARLVGGLARSRGVEVPNADAEHAEAEHAEVRSLFAIALDNAAEGLVRETWGAAVGTHQAQRALDPDVRAAMASIAPDEVQHAALSRVLHLWLWDHLSDQERLEVEACRLDTWRAFLNDVPQDPALSEALGLPPAAAVPAMVRVLRGACVIDGSLAA